MSTLQSEDLQTRGLQQQPLIVGGTPKSIHNDDCPDDGDDNDDGHDDDDDDDKDNDNDDDDDDDHNHGDDDVDVAHDDYDVDHDDDDQDHDLHIVGTVCDNMQHIKTSAFPLYNLHGSTIQLGLQGPRDDDDVLINIISSVIAKLSFC